MQNEAILYATPCISRAETMGPPPSDEISEPWAAVSDRA
jgi:hypothetical protein